MKKLLDVNTYDHPLVFLVFMALALIPVLYVVYSLAGRFNLPVPAISSSAQGS